MRPFACHLRRTAIVAYVVSAVALATTPTVGDEPKNYNILFVNADNWAWPHAGCYGDKTARTTHFDQLAAEGVLFRNAFCVVPSCTPARGVILTGQTMHRLGPGGNLWGTLPAELPIYTEALEAAGYVVGFTGKGWSPGRFDVAGRSQNPAGQEFESFAEFLAAAANKRFCFWYGDVHTARHKIVQGGGRAAGYDPAEVQIPASLPDVLEVREDVADYYAAVERWDAQLGELLAALVSFGRAADTLVVVCGDNGWQFPRGLANVYDTGTHVPLVVRLPDAKTPREVDEFVSFADFAPTFLEAANLKPLPGTTGRSLWPLLRGETDPSRDHVFLERERHANVRQGDGSYPCRAVRTRDYLYVRNFFPERHPAGDPRVWYAVGDYGDVDGSPTKKFVLSHQADPDMTKYFRWSFALRPAEELYFLPDDPEQLHNVANGPRHAAQKQSLQARLETWMRETADPRATNPGDERWDKFPYYGGKAKASR